MKFGTNIMGLSLRHFPAVAKAYEECGFESVWVPEHLVFPAEAPSTYPFSINGEPPFTPDTPTYDAWVLLTYIAAATERIRLGTSVYILPLRHPIQTARSVVTLDRVSNGRVTLGVGVGWLDVEFEYVGLSFDDRGRRADAAIDALRALWTEDVIEIHDEHFDFGPVKFQPKPLQKPSIPIEVGGVSMPALRRAGSRGDGWIEVGSQGVEDFRQKLDVVLEARAQAGRTGAFEVTVFGDLAHDPSQYEALAEAGATRLVVDPRAEFGPRLDPDTVIDWATRFADTHIERQ
jgi:probable F420-dependent oxidoreductase